MTIPKPKLSAEEKLEQAKHRRHATLKEYEKQSELEKETWLTPQWDTEKRVTYTDIQDGLNAIVAERVPWNTDAMNWLISHGLIIECTTPPPENFTYYELTKVGSNLYYNILTHFKTMLDAFHDAGQINIK